MASPEEHQQQLPAAGNRGSALAALRQTAPLIIVLIAAGCSEPSPGDLSRRAQIDTSRNDLDAARKKLDRAIQQQPDSAAIHLQLSQVLLRKNDFGQALLSYRRALGLDPMLTASPQFRSYLDDAASIEKRSGALAAYARLADELPAESVGAMHAAACDLASRIAFRSFMASAHAIAAALPKSIGKSWSGLSSGILSANFDALRESIRQLYDDTTRTELLESVDQCQTHYQAAMKLSDKSLRIDKRFAAARLNQAMMKIQMDAGDEGLAIVLDVLESAERPGAEMKLLAALMLERKGRFDDAEPLVRAALEQEPHDLTGRYLRAGILLHLGDLEQLAPLAERLAQENPTDRRGVFIQGVIDLLEGRYESAARRLGGTAGQGEAWDTFEFYRVLANYRTGNMPAAQASRLIANASIAFPEALLMRAAIAAEAGEPDRAGEACRRLLDLQPADADALRLLAISQIMKRQVAESTATLTRYLELRPDASRELQALAAARMAAGEIDAVIADNEKPDGDPGKPEPVRRRILALAYSLAGNGEKAEEQYQSLRQFDASSPDYWLYRSRRLALQGDGGAYLAAAAECRSGLAAGASAPPLLATMGVLNTMAGHFAEAREELAVAATAPAESQFIVDVYFALADNPHLAAAAAEILSADPFSRRAFDLLIIARSQQTPDGNLRDGLDKLANSRPGVMSLLNRAVVLRRKEAARSCSRSMIDLDALWPRLIQAHKHRPNDWM